MRVPTVRGLIDRRILVNYRVAPEVLERLVPAPFRPQLVGGWGIAGICLIRLQHVRPAFLPSGLGWNSENAAHRVAVEWERGGKRETGVYIARRDSSSRFNALVGGRLFPGVHHHARFEVRESEDKYHVRVDSDDRQVHVLVDARPAPRLPASSVFPSVRAASEFFRRGAIGYSDSQMVGAFDGLKLDTAQWQASPLVVERIETSFFDDPRRFPRDAIQFDSALLMRCVEHQWIAQPMLCCEPATA